MIIIAGFVYNWNKVSVVPSKEVSRDKISFIDGRTVLIQMKDKVVTTKIANTDASREQGLSGKQPLATDTGMLFVFPKPDKYGFWIKDMKYPLDIVWISSDYKIVHIEHSLAPETYPKSFANEIPAQYVIELPAGYMKANSITEGDSINIK